MCEQPGAIRKEVNTVQVEALHPAWQQQAKCLGVGNDYFFGKDDAQMTMNISQVRRAAKLCETCPVFRECITWALENREEYGIWAGSTGKVRKNIRGMITRGEVTIPEVIEDYCHGETAKYRPRPERRDHRSRVGGVPTAHVGEVSG